VGRTEVMLIRPVSDARIDSAHRTVSIDGGPLLAYERSYGAAKTIRWRPTKATLLWSYGVLVSVYVAGYRLRKDGSLGLMDDGHKFRIDDDGKVLDTLSFDYPTAWLQSIVDAYGQDMPAATLPPVREPGPLRCPPCAVGTQTIIREGDPPDVG
jgi:hypothetical protein